jgi:FkbM family methyltransferase
VPDVRVEEVESDVGPLWVHADDSVITPIIRAHGTWEQQIGDQLRTTLKPGMTAVDVGGNIGYVALLMAELVGRRGRVFAIEPDPGNAEVCRRNAARTRGAPIEVIEAAAWSEPGELQLQLHADNTGDHRIGIAGADRETVAVRAVRLDDVLPEKVDLILMDTQASEHVALRGARQVLERSRPVVFVEFWPQGLREAETDPVSVLDGYRALGLGVSGAEEELPEDPGEMVVAVDAGELPFTTLRLDPIDPLPPARERLLPASRRLGRKWARRFPPTAAPGTLAYDAAQRALVASVLDEEGWRRLFADGAKLPAGLGAGFDERVVEYGWLFSRGLSGRVLDAGSVLNHRHLAERLLPAIDDLTIVTLAPEPTSLQSLGISYLYADLRQLPLRDDWFDEVVCLSTIEHVGMDNAVYGGVEPRSEEPREDAAQALRELLRVVKPGGRIHLSVPFGRRQDHGWFRQLDREDVDDLLRRAGVEAQREEAFLYTPQGWQRSTAQAAAPASYNADEGRAADGAVAARAVLCLTIVA